MRDRVQWAYLRTPRDYCIRALIPSSQPRADDVGAADDTGVDSMVPLPDTSPEGVGNGTPGVGTQSKMNWVTVTVTKGIWIVKGPTTKGVNAGSGTEDDEGNAEELIGLLRTED